MSRLNGTVEFARPDNEGLAEAAATLKLSQRNIHDQADVGAHKGATLIVAHLRRVLRRQLKMILDCLAGHSDVPLLARKLHVHDGQIPVAHNAPAHLALLPIHLLSVARRRHNPNSTTKVAA